MEVISLLLYWDVMKAQVALIEAVLLSVLLDLLSPSWKYFTSYLWGLGQGIASQHSDPMAIKAGTGTFGIVRRWRVLKIK